jgi:hypothetical protein
MGLDRVRGHLVTLGVERTMDRGRRDPVPRLRMDASLVSVTDILDRVL